MKIGELDVSKIMLGSTEISSIYLGATQVYDGGGNNGSGGDSGGSDLEPDPTPPIDNGDDIE